MRRRAIQVRKYANALKVRIGRDQVRALTPAEAMELQRHVSLVRDGAQFMRPIRLKVDR